MKITFLGATHEVTGSCTLLETQGKRILVDCGMEQGADIFVNQEIPVNPAEIDCVLLTHAHIDHSGNLPLLYKNGFRGKIYATEATTSLCRIMLRDCAHIQEFEARVAQPQGQALPAAEGYEPLYDIGGCARARSRSLRPVPLRPADTGAARAWTSAFADVGHLLGSRQHRDLDHRRTARSARWCSAAMSATATSPSSATPSTVADADYVVIESTYGDRLS